MRRSRRRRERRGEKLKNKIQYTNTNIDINETMEVHQNRCISEMYSPDNPTDTPTNTPE